MDFFAIIDWVISELIALGQWLIGIIVDVLNFALAVGQFIWDTLTKVWNFITLQDGILKDFFDNLWNEVIVPFVEWAQQIIDDITTWLANFLDPIITFLQKLNTWYMNYVYKYLKDILEVLQRVRVILSVLRILGAQWATKLDADIAKIQGYVTTAIQDITGTLNLVSTWLNILIDPYQIIRKDFFTGTLFSSLGSVKAANHFGETRQLTATEAQSELNDGQLLTPGPAVLTRNADGSVTFSDSMNTMNKNFGSAANYYGFAGPPH